MNANISPLSSSRDRACRRALQLVLLVEQVELAGRAGHVQVDDALGLRRQRRRLRRERIRVVARRREAVASEQLAERERAQARAAALEQPAARDGERMYGRKCMRVSSW
jgi:hypothetical protein